MTKKTTQNQEATDQLGNKNQIFFSKNSKAQKLSVGSSSCKIREQSSNHSSRLLYLNRSRCSLTTRGFSLLWLWPVRRDTTSSPRWHLADCIRSGCRHSAGRTRGHSSSRDGQVRLTTLSESCWLLTSSFTKATPSSLQFPVRWGTSVWPLGLAFLTPWGDCWHPGPRGMETWTCMWSPCPPR